MPTRFSVPTALLAGLLTASAVSAQTTDPATKHEAADNTKANATDRNANARTPTDQSNDQDAINVTAGIRRAVLDDKSLSTSAHNIKIVTKGDVVTLRGPVASAEEKQRIETLAMQAAAGKQVRNEISIAR